MSYQPDIRKVLRNRFLGVFVFPLSLSQWIPIPIDSHVPEVTTQASAWEIKTAGNAGGFAYLLPTPVTQKEHHVALTWKWRVSKFPNANPQIPFEKISDDYAIRVGALLTDTEERMKIPSQFENTIREHKEVLSYVVFYCAVPAVPGGVNCAPNPFNDHVINCLLPIGTNYRKVEASPIDDAAKYLKIPKINQRKLKLIGVWIFADSDNSHSSSAASLQELQLVSDK